jgi:hypothetical protein
MPASQKYSVAPIKYFYSVFNPNMNHHVVNRYFVPRLAAEFCRKSRHLLLGEVALELSCSLATAEYQLKLLEICGHVRRLSQNELTALGLNREVVAYASIDMEIFNVLEKS